MEWGAVGCWGSVLGPCTGWFSLSSEEEERGRRKARGVRVQGIPRLSAPVLCYGMSEKHGNETGAANTSDLVKFAENPCHVLPDKGQEPSGCFYPAV